MGKNRNIDQVQVEIIIKNELPKKLQPFAFNQNYAKVTASSKWIRKIYIPLKNNNKLELDLIDANGNQVDIAQALLPKDHIVASEIKLKEGEEEKDFNTMKRGQTTTIKGELVLYDYELMNQQDEMRNKYTERFDKRLKRLKNSHKEEIDELEQDHKDEINTKDTTIKTLKNLVNYLNQEQILNPTIASSLLATQLSGSIVKQAEKSSIISEDLKKALPGLYSVLKIEPGNGEKAKLTPERNPDVD